MLAVIRREFEDPVDQVMFILGFKHDPRFRTALEAMKAGADPGIVNAIDQLEIYGAINATLCGLGAVTKKIHEDFGSDVPLRVREELYEIMVKEMGEKDYGGKWFPMTEVPVEHWVSLGAYSQIFRRRGRWIRTEVFCVPAPYFKLLSQLFE